MKLFTQHSMLDLSHIHVMGILNVTPDSFFDGGVYNTLPKAIDHVNMMINAGATIIDVGGESTRPGATEILVEEELDRVIPVIESIAHRFDVWISVDTSKPEVMRQAANVGVHMINDIRSLTAPGALAVVAETGLAACLMHMKGQPKTMQCHSKYNNIIAEISSYFAQNIERYRRAGILNNKLVLDPGFGFSKNIAHNYMILAHLSHFHNFNLPLLVGMSRKSMIGQLLNIRTSKLLNGSIACAVLAAIQGVNIIRVHDVQETVEAIRVVEATLSAKGKYYE